MSHINAFLCRDVTEHSPVKGIGKLGYYTEKAGNWCLSPLRNLFNGKKITVFRSDSGANKGKIESLQLSKQSFEYTHHLRKLGFLKVVLNMGLLGIGTAPGILLKGVAHLGSGSRERYQASVKNCKPIRVREIGTSHPLSIAEIKKELDDPFKKKIEVLIIHGNGEPIAYDNIGLNHIRITKKVILHNTYIPNGEDEMLSFQGFKNWRFKCFPKDSEFEKPRLRFDSLVKLPEGELIGYTIYSGSNEIIDQKECSSDEVREAEKKFDQDQAEKNKQKLDAYFTKHPLGLVAENRIREGIGIYRVKEIKSALQDKTNKRVYIYS